MGASSLLERAAISVRVHYARRINAHVHKGEVRVDTTPQASQENAEESVPFLPQEPPAYDEAYDEGEYAEEIYDVAPSRSLVEEQARRLVPHNVNAEIGLLGAMMLSKDLPPEISRIVSAADFYLPQHQALFNAIMQMSISAEVVDPITVRDRVEKMGILEKVGGDLYLQRVNEEAASPASADYYARLIVEKSQQRQLIAGGQKIVDWGQNISDALPLTSAIDRSQALMFEIGQGRHTQDYVPFSQAVTETLHQLELIESGELNEAGLPTGFVDFDKNYNGFRPGQMIIVAARPGMGKSTFAVDVMRHVTFREDRAAILFSLEMSRHEVMLRMISAELDIEMQRLQGLKKVSEGRQSSLDWRRLDKFANDFSQSKLYIDDSPNITMMEIRAKSRRLKQTVGLDLIIVDYIQLLQSGRPVESRQLEVSEFSRQLKLLAKELEVPIIAVAQLNRGAELRADKRPQVADLRESGALEQDADMVLLLHRDIAADIESEESKLVELIVGKNRGGATGTVQLTNRLEVSKFANYASFS